MKAVWQKVGHKSWSPRWISESRVDSFSKKSALNETAKKIYFLAQYQESQRFSWSSWSALSWGLDLETPKEGKRGRRFGANRRLLKKSQIFCGTIENTNCEWDPCNTSDSQFSLIHDCVIGFSILNITIMSPTSTALTLKVENGSPYQLSHEQVCALLCIVHLYSHFSRLWKPRRLF